MNGFVRGFTTLITVPKVVLILLYPNGSLFYQNGYLFGLALETSRFDKGCKKNKKQRL